MKKTILCIFILFVGIAGLSAQSKRTANNTPDKQPAKPAMQYEYVLSHEDSLLIKGLLLDPPVPSKPFPFPINPYQSSRPFNDVIIFDGDMNKQY
jgi:hypothetical protein